MTEYNREPCPLRIVDDIGSAFTLGTVGGGIFGAVGGYRHAAKGRRLRAMFSTVRVRGPLTGVQFAAWGGVFSAFDCMMVAIRKKEDPLNSIVSGFLTGGFLAARSGPRVMAASAMLGGIILGMFEGMGTLMTRWSDQMLDPTLAPPPEPELNEPPRSRSKPQSEFL